MATIIKTWDAAVELAATNAFGGAVADVAADQAYDYTGDVDLETSGHIGAQVLVETKLNFSTSRSAGAPATAGGLYVDVFASLDGSLYDTIPYKSFLVKGSVKTKSNPDGDYQRFSFLVENLAHFRIGLRTTGTEDTFDYRITHQLWILTNA